MNVGSLRSIGIKKNKTYHMWSNKFNNGTDNLHDLLYCDAPYDLHKSVSTEQNLSMINNKYVIK